MSLVERLRAICAAPNVIADAPGISAYAPAQGWPAGSAPLAVALPGDRAQVAAVLRAVSDAGASFVLLGAGTSAPAPSSSNRSQPGGFVAVTATNPPGSTIVVALTRLRQVLAVAHDVREVSCEPGVPLEALRRACGPLHTVLPGLQAATGATVGGVIAAGGGRRELLGIELVTATGATATLDRRQPGYDLAGAFVGSCGAQGAAVVLRLRLAPAGNGRDEPRSGDER